MTNDLAAFSNDADGPARNTELLQRFFDGTLTRDEADELLALWEHEPELKAVAQAGYFTETLFPFLHHSNGIISPDRLERLKDAARTQYGVAQPFLDLDELARLAAEAPSLPRAANADTPLSSRYDNIKPFDRNTGRSWLPLKILAPLFLILFGLAVYLEFRPTPSEEPDLFGSFPARITEAIEASFEEGVLPLKKDQRLEPGPIEFLSGLLEIEYKNGVRVVLEGPAKYYVETPQESACDFGKLSFFVPPKGKGFTVTTPKMTVRDLGTAFFLNVDPDNTELHVIEGEVEANWMTKDWIPFKAGRGVGRQEGKEARNFVADPKIFVSEEKVIQRKNEYVDRRQSVWTEHLEKRLNDPSLVWRLEADSVSRLRKSVGSRKDKTAIEFRQPHDRVDFSLRKEYRSLTLVASVRLNDMQNAASTLLMGNDFYTTPGTVHWQLSPFGALQFHVSDGRSAMMFDSDAVVRREDCKTWMTLALVVNAEENTITHYLDGRPVKTLHWNNPIPLQLDLLALGNERVGSRKSSNRFFHGAVEDFWIFNRPFSAGEIRDFHVNNQ